MLERAVKLIIVGTVAVTMLVAVLPKLIPLAAIIFVMAVIGRWVWWLTR